MQKIKILAIIISLCFIFFAGINGKMLYAGSPVIENTIQYRHYSNVSGYNLNTLHEKKKSAHNADASLLIMFHIPQANPDISFWWGLFTDVSYNQLYTKQASLALSFEILKKSVWSWRGGFGAAYYNDLLINNSKHMNESLYCEYNYFHLFRIYSKLDGVLFKYSEYRGDDYGNGNGVLEARIEYPEIIPVFIEAKTEMFYTTKRSPGDSLIDYTVENSVSSVYIGYAHSLFEFSAGYVFFISRLDELVYPDMDKLSVAETSNISKLKYYGGGAKLTVKNIFGSTDIFCEAQYAKARTAGEPVFTAFSIGTKSVF